MPAGKKITDGQHDGGHGQYLVGFLVGEMGHEWHPLGGNEAGIDGMIELRDRETREVNGQMIRAQVKTGKSHIENETETGFTWTPSAKDLAYWEASNSPVIVVVARLATRQAWWVALDDAYPDADARAARTLHFDKARGRFDADARDALWGVARREEERRAVATRMVIAGPYAAVGLLDDYQRAQQAIDERRWTEAAALWEALESEARAKRLDPRLIWPAAEQNARALEQAGQKQEARLIWIRLARERVERDDADASLVVTRAYFDGAAGFEISLLQTRAEAPEAGVDALPRFRALSPKGAAESRSRAAALVDALTFYGHFTEAEERATRALGKRIDTAEKRQLALDRLDCLAELGEEVGAEWKSLLGELEDQGPHVYGIGLQRRAVAYARGGEFDKAREYFDRAQAVWARVEGGEEQVAEVALCVSDLDQLGTPGEQRPLGLRQAAALARGNLATPAARSDRLINGGLAYLADDRWPDAIARLTLAAMIDRRAGNLASYRRSAYFLARAYEDADEFADALRFWVKVGSDKQSAEVAPRLSEASLLELCRLEDGPSWERAASFAALAAGHQHLSDETVARLAETIVSAATPPFGLIAPQPSFHARKLLAAVSDRLPAKLAADAAKPLIEDIQLGSPLARDSSKGLVKLHQRGAVNVAPAIVEALLAGTDLPVRIAGWLHDADESVIKPLTEAALAGNRVALEELAAADIPERDPRLQEVCRNVISAAVQSAENEEEEAIGVSFVEFADLARFCEPRLQGQFVDMLLGVIASDQYDELSKTSALITVAMAAPGLAPTPADRALRTLLPIAEGRSLQSAAGVLRSHRNPKRSRFSFSRAAPPSAVRATAVQACGRLAMRVGPRSRAVKRMLTAALDSGELEVERMALREMTGLPNLARNLDLQPWLGHPDQALRTAAEELQAARLPT
jgi:Domain of unknown function (DUF4365)